MSKVSEKYPLQRYGEILDEISRRLKEFSMTRQPLDDFTPFINKIIKLDERTATFILGWLLNPKGSHGYGGHFLRHFLKIVCFPELSNKTEKDITRIHEEANFTLPLEQAPKNKDGYVNNMGAIDILVRGNDFIIAIEAKFDATDDDNQLEKYLTYIKLLILRIII